MFLLLSLLAMGLLGARAEAGYRCRTIAAYSVGDSNLSLQIEKDLLTGVWTQQATVVGGSDRVHTLLQFAAGGMVDFMQLRSEGGYDTDCLRWWVEVQDNEPLLLLEDRAGRRDVFRIEQTCHGIQLTNRQTGKRLVLNHHAAVKEAELKQLRGELAGDWSNTMYPFDPVSQAGAAGKQIAGAFLKYEFRSDGTYVKMVGGEKVVIKETGAWEISKDGRYLLMHANVLEGGRQTTSSSMARIKYLQLDELVLEHSLQVQDAKFCTRQKDFFFNKS